MRTFLFFTVLSFCISKGFASSLILGYTQPDEQMVLENGTFQYDSVILLNGAHLVLQNNARLTVTGLLVLKDSSVFSMEASRLDVYGIVWMDGQAKAYLRDTVLLNAHVYLIDSTLFEVSGAALYATMAYKGQFSWVVGGTAHFSIDGTVMNFVNGAVAGHFFEQAHVDITNSLWTSAILPMTATVTGKSQIYVDSLVGGAEFVVNDSAWLQIAHSDHLMIWYAFGDGQIADYAYPATNSSGLAHASDISGEYLFPDTNATVTQVDFTVQLDTVNEVFWGVISQPGSDVTIRNSDVYACGFFFEQPDTFVANEWNNANFYQDFSGDFSDRNFRVVNTSLQVINYYPVGHAWLRVNNSLFGEMLVMQNGKSVLQNSKCDGSGGYFGVQDSGYAVAYYTEFERTWGNGQIISVRHNGYLELHHCIIDGNVVVSGNGILVMDATKHNAPPQLLDAGIFIAVTDSAITGDSVVCETFLHFRQPDPAMATISDVAVYYSRLDSSDLSGPYSVSVYDSAGGQLLDFPLSPGTYRLLTPYETSYGDSLLVWHVYYLNGDSLFATTHACFSGVGDSFEHMAPERLEIYPNPSGNHLFISMKHPCCYTIYAMNGQIIQQGTIVANGIDVSGLNAGVYVIEVRNHTGMFYRSEFVKK